MCARASLGSAEANGAADAAATAAGRSRSVKHTVDDKTQRRSQAGAEELMFENESLKTDSRVFRYLRRTMRRTSRDGSLKLMMLRKGSGCSEGPTATAA
jgi:hypothetical protein